MAYARGRDSRRSRGGRLRGGGSRGGFGGDKKPKFMASRITGPNEGEYAGGPESGASEPDEGSQSPDNETLSEDGEDEDEDDLHSPNIRPYSVLIQSLNAKETSGQPRRKKRKLGSKGAQSPGPHIKDSTGYSGGAELNGDLDGVEADGDVDLSEFLDFSEAMDEEEQLGDTDCLDPYETHFANPDETSLSNQIWEILDAGWQMHRIEHEGLGKATIATAASSKQRDSVYFTGPENLKLKKRLSGPIHKLRPKFYPLEGAISPYIFNYQDFLFCARSLQSAEDLRTLTCLHALNHVFKTRDRVIKNNSRLAKGDVSEDVELRDQGFTRPKILMILPTRQSCARVIDSIITLCEPEQQENKKRFQDSYVEADDKISDGKPEDFRDLFGGNDDDMFRIGLKFTRKTIKFFAQFYNSDIIIASPLGLRMAIGTDIKKGDYDFLSSIEVMIVDQADALLMQNWEHMEYIFEHLNLQPKEAHGCDFSRVRNWYLDGNAKYRRQTIVLSAFNTPELNGIFSSHMKNTEGKAKFTNDYDGVMLELCLGIKQSFSRYDSPSLATDPDARFKYFTTVIVPSLSYYDKPTKELAGQGTLIFIPSYLDFVRIRNYFSSSLATQNLSFGTISEYTSAPDVARARSHFLSGRHSVLLYTERAHHFRRYVIGGVRRVIMYGLPDNPVFYREIVGGYIEKSTIEGKVDPRGAVIRSVFSKWDGLKLERVVGSKRVGMMIRSVGDTFDFV
ncbi:MAG: rRNA-binding ribosome biosynthesis protein utp25 [Geoglossum umbratile]|nr:MAG: rRNA-binding ribosome biosynthesis protein utp25 [Geoglossum umbratile]